MLFLAVHQFLVDPMSSMTLTSTYELNHGDNIIPNTIEDLDINFGEVECKIVTVYMNRLYVCSNERNENCYSWDLDTGKRQVHPALNYEYDSYCYHQVVEVNGKIMITGGIGDGSRLTKTAFLTPNFNWEEGPTMSKERAYHAAIAVDDTKVVLLGGSTGYTKLYNDETKSDTSLRYQSLSYYVRACKISDFNELGNDVILVLLSDKRMFTYNWQSNSWQELSDSWKASTEMKRNVLLFNAEGRLYWLGGSTSSLGNEYSSQVLERKNNEWISRGCDLATVGVAHYVKTNDPARLAPANVIDFDKNLVMNDKCMSIKSAEYPQKYPQGTDATLSISFPMQQCLNVSMKFQYIFDLPCNEHYLDINFITESDRDNVGIFCGSEIPHSSKMDEYQVTPLTNLDIHFRTDNSEAGLGFMLKVCTEACCYENGVANFWQEWSEWSHHFGCELNRQGRRRQCQEGCQNECLEDQYEVDTDKIEHYDTGKV